jgi:hypothetical protein
MEGIAIGSVFCQIKQIVTLTYSLPLLNAYLVPAFLPYSDDHRNSNTKDQL